jgi:hypothetical protein
MKRSEILTAEGGRTMHGTAKLLIALALSLSALVSMAAPAATQDDTTGTIIFSSRSVALGIGVSWGDGVLEWRGKTYVFTLSGLSVADLGISRITARGQVANLRRIEDFPGNYVAATAGATVGGGGGAAALRNQNGVEIAITGTARGVRFTVAGAGVDIRLK